MFSFIVVFCTKLFINNCHVSNYFKFIDKNHIFIDINNKEIHMSKEQQGQQMFQFSQKDKDIQIGTQILDPSMPSDLNFEDNRKKQYEGAQVDSNYKYVKGKSKITSADQIRSFSIKGKATVIKQPKYKCASIVQQHVDTFDVKAFDQQKSGGLKSLWETVIGYVNRQICIQQGYLYVFEKIKNGYMTHAALSLSSLFKIFIDPQQSKIRFVFHQNKQHLKTKNFKVKSCQQIIQKVGEEAGKMGLVVVSQ